jgi:hypothetical protein
MEDNMLINYKLYFDIVKNSFNICYSRNYRYETETRICRNGDVDQITKVYLIVELPSSNLCCKYNFEEYEEYMKYQKKKYEIKDDRIDLIKKQIELMDGIKKELIIYLSHPKYLIKYLESGNSITDYTDQF